MFRRLLLAAVVLLPITMTASAQAGLIPIINAGFEDPPTTTFNNGLITGWTISGSGAGVWNINDAPLGFWDITAPEGKQIAYVSPAPAPGNAASISQVLGASLAANTVYTLSGEVGHPIGFGTTVNTVYTIELLAGANVLGSLTGTGPEGMFAHFELTFDSAGSAWVGQSLEIRLSSSQNQTGFDAITLDARPVPEPATITLLGTGGLFLLGACWNRSGRTCHQTVNSKPA